MGKIQDALVDFTGGVGEMIQIQENNRENNRSAEELFTYMTEMTKMNTLMGCSMSVSLIINNYYNNIWFYILQLLLSM